jgi:hypothetical protein
MGQIGEVSLQDREQLLVLRVEIDRSNRDRHGV